jgi:hypothetical protein
VKSFRETYYNLPEGALSGETPANRSDGCAGYDPKLGVYLHRRKRVKFRSPKPAPAVKFATYESQNGIAHLQVQHPNGRWLTLQSTENDSQIYGPLLRHYARHIHPGKRLRIVDAQGRLVDTTG